MRSATRVIVGIVHFGDAEPTAASVNRAISAVGSANVVVANNGPQDETTLADLLGMDTPSILGSGDNIGYGAAANRLGDAARDRGGSWLLLMNNDAWIDGASAERLVAGARDLSAWIAAPTIVYPDEATIWAAGLDMSRALGIPRNSKRGMQASELEPKARQVDFVTGCVQLLSLDEFPRRIRFDDRFFLYFEDVDICEAVHEQGGNIVLVPEAIAVHAKTLGRRRFGPIQNFHQARSGVLHYYKWKSGHRRVTWLIGLALLGAYWTLRSASTAAVAAVVRGFVSGIAAARAFR